MRVPATCQIGDLRTGCTNRPEGQAATHDPKGTSIPYSAHSHVQPPVVNLFLIGVNKAGTSWLYSLLDRHPDVFMAEAKELYYFGSDSAAIAGIDTEAAYHQHFPFGSGHRYYGDATVMYYRDRDVAEQIHAYNPAARVLAIVRDPIDRLLSQFRYHKQIGVLPESASLAEALARSETRLLRDSRYEKTLPAFEERFGQRFTVVRLEKGRADPEALWGEVLAFLDLPPRPLPEDATAAANPTGSAAFRRLYRATVPPIRNHTPGFYRWMLQNAAVHWAKQALLRVLGTAAKDDLDAAMRARLEEEFAPTYAYLEQKGLAVQD
jgi:hypothetical protein